MQFVIEFLNWLEASRLAEFIRESEWAFPAAESVHVIALALVIGTISIVDLRLLGLASTNPTTGSKIMSPIVMASTGAGSSNTIELMATVSQTRARAI